MQIRNSIFLVTGGASGLGAATARMAAEGLVEETGGLWALKSRTRTKRVPRWLGGVCVDEQCPWRWDPAAGKLARI